MNERDKARSTMSAALLLSDLARAALDYVASRPNICGMVSASGPNGEPLACGYAPDHEPPAHSWATLPTFTLEGLAQWLADNPRPER